LLGGAGTYLQLQKDREQMDHEIMILNKMIKKIQTINIEG